MPQKKGAKKRRGGFLSSPFTRFLPFLSWCGWKQFEREERVIFFQCTLIVKNFLWLPFHWHDLLDDHPKSAILNERLNCRPVGAECISIGRTKCTFEAFIRRRREGGGREVVLQTHQGSADRHSIPTQEKKCWRHRGRHASGI